MFRSAPGCRCCVADCDSCTTTSEAPGTWSVELPSANNEAECSNCSDFAGTYSVPRTPGQSPSTLPCEWDLTLSRTGLSCGDPYIVQVHLSADISTGPSIRVIVFINGDGGPSGGPGGAFNVGWDLPLGQSVNCTVSPTLTQFTKIDCTQTYTLTTSSDITFSLGGDDFCTIPNGSDIVITPV